MPQEMVMTLAAVVTAIGVIIGALIAIYRVARRIGDAIGLDKEGRTISERLSRVEHQLWENGGSSLADRVNTIETHTTATAAKIEIIETILTSQWWATPTSSNEQSQVPVVSPRKTRQKKIS
jgi:hypothetical protein